MFPFTSHVTCKYNDYVERRLLFYTKSPFLKPKSLILQQNQAYYWIFMAGIYLHIPFCKTRCIYCDFFSTTQSHLKSCYIEALCKELRMRKEYLEGEDITTIYFGGGTPSQLDEEDFKQIFSTIHEVYGLEKATEITLEANPDDLTPEYIHMLTTLPFNRVSMGIQTFHDPTLKLLNRRHNAAQAIQAVEQLRKEGFNNISIDLIYGLPGETLEQWENDLKQAISLRPEHISAYHLTYEEGTCIYRMLTDKQITEVDEECSLTFFSTLIDRLSAAGYKQYEISNFCLPHFHSRHNSSYWIGVPYLGCGPSAHSYNKISREWNIASLEKYITSIEANKREYETETLSLATRYNEFIMTGLRTMQGISLQQLEERFGTCFAHYCNKMSRSALANQLLENTGEQLRLTHKGIFVSDDIISDLLWIEEEEEE